MLYNRCEYLVETTFILYSIFILLPEDVCLFIFVMKFMLKCSYYLVYTCND